MNYPAATMGAGTAPGVEMPRTIPSLVETIHQALRGTQAAENRLGQTLGRLVNPRPEGVATDGAVAPVASTVEAQLSEVLRVASNLEKSLHTLADRFESAV